MHKHGQLLALLGLLLFSTSANKNGLFYQKYYNICDRVTKVLSLLEACFDLISGSTLHMKIQIMGGKITENLGFKSPLRKVKLISFGYRKVASSNTSRLEAQAFSDCL